MQKRARRIQDRERMKARAKRVMLDVWKTPEKWVTPDSIGRNADTHCRPCSCWMCVSRKWEVRKTPRQRRRIIGRHVIIRGAGF